MALTAGLATGGKVCLAAQILDRVVASLGNVAITESDVEQEYRFERFLDAQWPPPSPSAALLTDARERLTYQMLLTQEENPGPDDRAESGKSALGLLATLRQNFAHPEDYQRAVKDLRMTETEVVARIAQQELMLRLIDQRLRPEASPSDDEVTDYYRSTFAPEFQKKNNGAAAPPLSQVEGQIREVLVQKRINELLDEWIEELKPTTNVRFHSF
ncbi:MAG: hypothetical protein ACLQVL_34295 [Terriglobia bacterium]